MVKLQFHKVNRLPDVFEPNTIYLVSGPDSPTFQIYISDNNGESVRHTGAFKKRVENIQATQIVDAVSASVFGSMKWLIQIEGTAGHNGKRAIMEIMAVHNGHDEQEATFVDYNIFGKLKTDPFTGLEITVNLESFSGEQFLVLYVNSPGFPVNIHVTRNDLLAL